MAQEEEMKLIKLFKEKIMVGRSLHTEKTMDQKQVLKIIKKSHKDYGFEEPIYSFVPSIGISQIIKNT